MGKSFALCPSFFKGTLDRAPLRTLMTHRGWGKDWGEEETQE